MRRAKIETVLKADKSYQTRVLDTETREDRLSRYDDRYRTGIPVCCSVEEQYYRATRGDADEPEDRYPLIKIKYLGVWDTVKTLTKGDESDHDFHIDDIVEIVESSRHAIAIDEYREPFNVTTFKNINDANRRAFFKDDKGVTDFDAYKKSPQRKHQEMWFPGNHGSVGGGGDVRGLSDAAYLWVLEGAKRAGLRLDTSDISRVFQIKPDCRASLDNSTADPIGERIWSIWSAIKGFQRIGPRALHEVHRSTILRVAYSKHDKETDVIYDPGPLSGLWSLIEREAGKFSKEDFDLALGYDEDHEIGSIRCVKGQKYYVYFILAGERLENIAHHWLGDREHVSLILAANRVMIPNIDTYQAGQFINLPVNEYLKDKLAE
jgi:hypothetical protein